MKEPLFTLIPERVQFSQFWVEIRKRNRRILCNSTTTLEADWHTDFAKSFDSGLVQIQVQFGKVELMFKDFCGFRIAYNERRLRLGVESNDHPLSVIIQNRSLLISA